MADARTRDLCIIHTSTPSFPSDVRVAQAGDSLGFAQKTNLKLWRRARAGGQDLERHDAAEAALAGGEDPAHATAAEFLDDFVGTEAGGLIRVEGVAWRGFGRGNWGIQFEGYAGTEAERAFAGAAQANSASSGKRMRGDVAAAWAGGDGRARQVIVISRHQFGLPESERENFTQ